MHDRYDTVIIGGGQAGLAVGFFLRQQARDFAILDAGPELASAWRSRWDSLSLFTPARYDSLPGLAFPGDPDHYPTRNEVIAYLSDYAERFDLPVQLDRRVTSVDSVDGGWALRSGARTIEARNVVVATGAFQAPRTPVDLAERLGPDVQQLHSSEYRRASDVRGATVLVVGGGNTGYQIAEELSATRTVHLAIGTAQKPMPRRLFGRDIFVTLDRLGVMRTTAHSRLGRRLKENDTLVGYGPKVARRLGIEMHDRAIAAGLGSVSFADRTRVEPDAVVWATGYRPDHSFVHAPVFDEQRQLVHTRGVTPAAGLYFVGLPWMHTRGSALLGWVKDDAEFIADQIQTRTPNRVRQEVLS